MNESSSARKPHDSGIAVVTVVLGGVLVMLLAVTSIALVTTSVQNTSADRQSLTALAAAESGVADAVTYVREVGLSPFVCTTCGDNEWIADDDDAEACAITPGGAPVGKMLQYGNGSTATVTVRLLESAGNSQLRVCSVGESPGEGQRIVQQTLAVAPMTFPFGLFARDSVSATGSTATSGISVFSRGTIHLQNFPMPTGDDKFYSGLPASVYAREITFREDGKGKVLDLHKDTPPCGDPRNYLDSDGGMNCTGGDGVYSKRFDPDSDMEQFGVEFQADELALLRRAAIERGTYFTDKNARLPEVQAGERYMVAYYDLAAGQQVSLQQSDVPSFQTTDWTTCSAGTSPPVLILVVAGGDLRINSGLEMGGVAVVQDGTITVNGGTRWTGPMLARDLVLGGGGGARPSDEAAIQLTDCFVQNLPGLLLEAAVTDFHEIDR